MAEDMAKKLLDTIKKNKYICALIIFGAVLLLIPKGGDEPAVAAAEENEFSLYEHETRISAALSEISGAGRVTVVLTLRNGGEKLIASDVKTGTGETERETVIVSTGSSAESPVTLKTIYPEYMGALIVAEGADSPEVKLALKQAASVLTGLGTDRITISKMK